MVFACTPSTRHRQLIGTSSKGGVTNNEVANFPQLFKFSPTFPNHLGDIQGSGAASVSEMSMKKQQLLLQRTQRQRQRMCPKSKNSYNVCKIGMLCRLENIGHSIFYLIIIPLPFTFLL